jgi:hypothetical protein
VDLQLYARVLWRFKLLVLLGLMLAAALATISLVRVSPDGLTYRQVELWQSTTRLGVTQNGFPWGRLLATEPTTEPTVGEQAQRLGIPIADPNRLNGLTVLYAELATSDPVRQLMRRDGPIGGQIIATPVIVGESRNLLPLIDLVAISTSPQAAIKLAERGSTAFDTYLREQQRANKVPAADRVVVEQLMRPRAATIFQGRSMTMPIVIFLAVMFATVALIFLLENLRPRRRELDESAAEAAGPPQRRTA